MEIIFNVDDGADDLVSRTELRELVAQLARLGDDELSTCSLIQDGCLQPCDRAEPEWVSREIKGLRIIKNLSKNAGEIDWELDLFPVQLVDDVKALYRMYGYGCKKVPYHCSAFVNAMSSFSFFDISQPVVWMGYKVWLAPQKAGIQ